MNLPNKITMTRICLIPIVVLVFYLEMIPYNRSIAALLFIITALTDFIDGHLARKNNLVTNLGKFLDPIADKVLVIVMLFLLIEAGALPSPYGAIGCSLIVARELMIGGFRQVAAASDIVIAADKTGKIKTITQDISIVTLLIMGDVKSLIWQDFHILCYVIFGIAVVLTVYSGFNYIVRNRQVLFPKRETGKQNSENSEE